MTTVWTTLGTIAQAMLAFFLFMLVVFSGAGIANNESISERELGLLNLSMFLLPALCVVSAGIVIVLHRRSGSALGYAWYLMPVVGAALYLAYAFSLMRRSP